jgi:hypothetical protein
LTTAYTRKYIIILFPRLFFAIEGHEKEEEEQQKIVIDIT